MSKTLYIAEPSIDSVKSNKTSIKSGDVLVGRVKYVKEDGRGAKAKPPVEAGSKICYSVPPFPPESIWKKESDDQKKKKESSKNSKKSGGDETQDAKDVDVDVKELNEKLRDTKLDFLGSIEGDEKFETFYQDFLKEYPDFIKLRQRKLHYLDNPKKQKQRMDNLNNIITEADGIIALIDQNELALHFGTNIDDKESEEVKLRSTMKEKKEQLIDALARKAKALFDLSIKHSDSAPEPERVQEEITTTMKTIKKWDKIENDRFSSLLLSQYNMEGKKGKMLGLLRKLIDKSGSSPSSKDKDAVCGLTKEELYAKRTALLDDLGWQHVNEYNVRWKIIDCPKSYEPF